MTPSRASRFGEVSSLIRRGDPATAFTRAAEVLLERFELLKKDMGAAAVIKLAIDCHRHALFCEVAVDKAKTQHDTAAYAAFQEYLNGTTDIPIATGLPQAAVVVATSPVDVDDEGDSDGEETEDE